MPSNAFECLRVPRDPDPPPPGFFVLLLLLLLRHRSQKCRIEPEQHFIEPEQHFTERGQERKPNRPTPHFPFIEPATLVFLEQNRASRRTERIRYNPVPQH